MSLYYRIQSNIFTATRYIGYVRPKLRASVFLKTIYVTGLPDLQDQGSVNHYLKLFPSHTSLIPNIMTTLRTYLIYKCNEIWPVHTKVLFS